MRPRRRLILLFFLLYGHTCVSAPPSSQETIRTYQRAQTLLKAHKITQVKTLITQLQQRYIDPFLVRQLRLELATEAVHQGHYSEAKTLINAYLLIEEDPVIYPKAKELLAMIAKATHLPPPEKTQSEHKTTLHQFFQEEQYTQARNYARYMQDHVLPPDQMTEILYEQARAYYLQYNYVDAIALFQQAIGAPYGQTDTSAPTWRAQAKYYLGKALQSAQEPDLAAQRFQQIIRESKDPIIAPLAYYELCRYFQKKDNDWDYTTTLDLFQKAFPNSLPYKRILWENEGSVRLTLAPASSPLHKSPPSYYTAQLLTKKHTSDINPILTYLTQLHKTFPQLAKNEATYYLWKKGDYPYLLALTQFDTRDRLHTKTIRRLRTTLGEVPITHGDFPRAFIPHLYPRPYATLITRYAKAYALDPNLLFAIMRENSTFDPTHHGPNGRIGLMQLPPQTAKDIAFRLGNRWTGPQELENPATNIHYTSYYLRWLLDHFNNRVHETLAAYHNDPILAQEWHKKFGSPHFDPYVNALPYEETKALLRRTLDSYIIYKAGT